MPASLGVSPCVTEPTTMSQPRGSRAASNTKQRRRPTLAAPPPARDPDLADVLDAAADAARDAHRLALACASRTTNAIATIEASLHTNVARVRGSALQTDATLASLGQQLDATIGDLRAVHARTTETLTRLHGRLDRFSITVFGRTMAGKSTLMEILTQGQGASIGRGAQRTTRDVRVYTWRGLEVTDVPGIGAFEGQDDAAIAMKAAEQADLVIYLITSDAPQPIEAHYLAAVRRLGKPVLGVINVQHSLETESDRRRFLRAPDRAFDPARLRALTDQFEAFVDQHAPGFRPEFFPVHLDARYRAAQPAHASERDTLLAASRFDALERRIVREIQTHGALARYRALVDAASVPSIEVMERCLEFAERNADSGRVLIAKRKKLQAWIDRFSPSAHRRIDDFCAQAMSDLHDEVPGFVERYAEDEDLAERWSKRVSRAGILRGAEALQRELGHEASTEISELTRELRAEIELTGALGDKLNLAPASITDTRRLWDWGVGLAAGGLTIAALFVSGPIGWVAAGVGLVGGVLSFLFDSRADKLERARQRLTKKLHKSLEDQEQRLRKQLHGWLTHQVENALYDVRRRLDAITSALMTLADEQRGLAWMQNDQLRTLNHALLQRTLATVGQPAEAERVVRAARVPGIALMLLIRPGRHLAGAARHDAERALGEKLLVVVDSPDERAVLRHALDARCQVRIDPRLRKAHAHLGEISARTAERVRLAQQLTALHVVIPPR